MKTLALFLLLAVIQFALRPESAPAAGERGLRRAFPGAAAALVLGAARPLVLHWLWWRFETSCAGGDFADSLRSLHLLREADPGNGRAARYLARFLAFNVAPREPGASGRIARVLEALDALEKHEARYGPDPECALDRVQILRGPWAAEPALHRVFRSRRGLTPSAAAVAAARDAVAGGPGHPEMRLVLAESLRERAVEQIHEGKAADARIGFEEARLRLGEGGVPDGDPLAILAEGWLGLARALEAGEGGAARDALATLARALELLPAPDRGGGLDDAFVASVLPLVLDLARNPERPMDDAGALSLVLAAHNMHVLLGRRQRDASGDPTDAARRSESLKAAVAEIIKRAPDLAGRVPEPLRPGGH